MRVTPEDIIPVAEYQNIKRDVYYPMRRAIKKIRQIEIGPFASITFENYDLVWVQIQGMLVLLDCVCLLLHITLLTLIIFDLLLHALMFLIRNFIHMY